MMLVPEPWDQPRSTGRRAVFLDRDGTLNLEVGYLHDPERLLLFPGVARAIRRLNDAGLFAVLVTNQSGIGRGYFELADLQRVHDRLQELLWHEKAYLDAIYFCPHRPGDDCDCRKPEPGMLYQAAREHSIALFHSLMVGDKKADVLAGQRAGCRSALVLTGYGVQTRQSLSEDEVIPDCVAAGLEEAVDWFLAQVRAETGC